MIRFDGRQIAAHLGQTVAAALVAAGIRAFRTTRHGAPRGLFCGMGVCHDCLVTIDGRPNQRACMAKITGPHEVSSQVALPMLTVDGNAGPIPAAPEAVEVLVVGGGAGGLTAAAVAAEAGAQFTGGRRLLARARSAGVRFVAGAVWSASLPLRLEVYGEGGARTFLPRRVIVATGAFERPLPVPGWTLPGVMTTGGLQTLLRSYGVLPGQTILIAGNGPLNLQVACELARAGGEIVAVVEAARRPGPWALNHLAAMASASPGLTARGASYLRRLARHGIPVRWGSRLAAVAAEGEALAARLDNGSIWRTDIVAMGYGFLPANELLRLLGCRHRYDTERRHLVTERDGSCRTSVPNVLAVGDCCGLGGAMAAEAEGVIAGAVAAGRAPDPRMMRSLARQRRFQAGLWHLFASEPAGHAMTRDTLVCRCEDVGLAAIDAAFAAGAASLAALKRATRVGMGRCQGRYCGPLLAELLHERAGLPLDEFAFFAARPPVRPVPVGAIAVGEAACPQ